MKKINHIETAPDAVGTLATVFFADGTKLSVTLAATPACRLVNKQDVLVAVAAQLGLPATDLTSFESEGGITHQNDYAVVELSKRSALVVNRSGCSSIIQPAAGVHLRQSAWNPVIETHPQIADTLARTLGKRGLGLELTQPEKDLLVKFYEFQAKNPGKAWRPDWFATIRGVAFQHQGGTK